MRNGKHYPPKFASPSSWARPCELRNPRDTLTAAPRTFQDYAPRMKDAYGTQSKPSGYPVVIVVVAIPRLRGLEAHQLDTRADAPTAEEPWGGGVGPRVLARPLTTHAMG